MLGKNIAFVDIILGTREERVTLHGNFSFCGYLGAEENV